MARTDPLEVCRQIARRLEDDRIRRDTAIRVASEAGYSLREIAEAIGMSHGGVAKVLNGPAR